MQARAVGMAEQPAAAERYQGRAMRYRVCTISFFMQFPLCRVSFGSLPPAILCPPPPSPPSCLRALWGFNQFGSVPDGFYGSSSYGIFVGLREEEGCLDMNVSLPKGCHAKRRH